MKTAKQNKYVIQPSSFIVEATSEKVAIEKAKKQMGIQDKIDYVEDWGKV